MKAKAQEIYELAIRDLGTPGSDQEGRTFLTGGFPGPWIKFRNLPMAFMTSS